MILCVAVSVISTSTDVAVTVKIWMKPLSGMGRKEQGLCLVPLEYNTVRQRTWCYLIFTHNFV